MKPELTLKSVLRSAELAQRDIDPLESLGVGSQPEDDNAVSHESCAPSIMLQTTSDSNHSNADRHTHTSDKKSAVYAQGSADNSYSPLSGSLLIEKSEPNLRQSPKRKRVILSVAAIVLIVAIGIASYLQFNKKPAASAAKSPPPVVTVCTEAAKIQMMEDVLNVTGSVSAWDPLNVGAEVSGLRIKSVSVEEGDFVKKGQPLAVLNSALLKAKLDQAKARLDSAHASMTKSIQPNRSEDILALQAAASHMHSAVAQEEAHRKQCHVNLINAELNAKRFNELVRMGAVSAQDAETKQVALETAREELKSAQEKVRASGFLAEQAQQRLLAATRGGRSEDIAISRASLAETTAQVAHLEEEIAQTIIRAPDDGLISRRDAHIGDIASTGTPLFSLIRMNRLELRAQVSDLDLQKFHPGQTVNISTREDESTTEQLAGTVRLVSPQVDPSTRLGTVRIDLPANKGLKPGMFVRGQVRLDTRRAVTVPVQALIQRNGESFVFRLNGERAAANRVKTGTQTHKLVEIISGLEPNQIVITKGARFLSDGDVVKVSP